MKTEIFVMTHRAFDYPKILGYYPMQVGAALHEDLGYLRDDVGDHISDLNPYYAELTGIYWLWKNYHAADIIGICHYRRYFINNDHYIMKPGEFEELLKDHDIIASFVENEQSREELQRASIFRKDIDTVFETMHSLYPEDYQASRQLLSEEKGTYGNLMVMRKELFDEYCAWLFDILAEAGENIDLSVYDDFHRKFFGIVSEGMPGLYARSRGLRIYDCKTALASEKAETTELKEKLRQLVREGAFAEGIGLYHDTLAKRPDLTFADADVLGELPKMLSVLERLQREKEAGAEELYARSRELGELLAIVEDEAK
ncbi:MAG: DUF4422 domain-containing protein [Lachnospiraceae bacterium]|nr:DUF4422 domain-containing protein [Lachnospiraceae bacterium]